MSAVAFKKPDRGPLWMNKCKPSKAAGKDQTRPKLMSAAVIDDGDGRCLLATNSYILARIPVDPETPTVVVPPEALKRIEKGEVHEITENGAVRFKDAVGSVTIEPSQQAPFDKMPVEFDDSGTVVTIALNPSLLYDLAQALGAGDMGVRLQIRVMDGTTLRPMRVEPLADDRGPNGHKPWGLVMPIRVNA